MCNFCFSVEQVQLSEQILSYLACCWVIRQPTNKETEVMDSTDVIHYICGCGQSRCVRFHVFTATKDSTDVIGFMCFTAVVDCKQTNKTKTAHMSLNCRGP